MTGCQEASQTIDRMVYFQYKYDDITIKLSLSALTSTTPGTLLHLHQGLTRLALAHTGLAAQGLLTSWIQGGLQTTEHESIHIVAT